ncbi:MAG: hypothetical protein WDA60_07645 [Acidimicrobiia bacterium]
MTETPAPPTRRQAPGLDLLFSAVFALFGFGVGIERLSDNSFFTHLATGRWILDHGIPRSDFYSYTAPGTRWVVQSWLAEVLYAQLDRSFGAFGIRVLGALTGAAITVLVFRLALRLSRDRVRASLISVAALGGLYTLWSERPLLLGVLFFVILLWIVEAPECLVGRHPYVSLPVLFWLWANVHGTFSLGFAYLGLHLLGRWLDGARPWQGRERVLLVGSLIAFAACFVNPYGPALVLFPIELLGRGDILRHVIEWASPNFHDIRGQSFLLWLAVYVAVVARGRNRVSRRDLVVTIPFLILALWALRNVAIAPLVGVPVVARAMAIDPEVADERRRAEQPSPIGWVLAALLLAIGFGLVVRAVDQPDFVTTPYPVKAMNALEDRGLIGTRLLMDDGDAAYAELAYPGRQKVFMDDRYDMFPTAVIYDFFRLSNGSPDWKRVMDEYDVETVVWEKSQPLVQYLRGSGDWTEIHRDKTWVTLVRNDVG